MRTKMLVVLAVGLVGGLLSPASVAHADPKVCQSQSTWDFSSNPLVAPPTTNLPLVGLDRTVPVHYSNLCFYFLVDEIIGPPLLGGQLPGIEVADRTLTYKGNCALANLTTPYTGLIIGSSIVLYRNAVTTPAISAIALVPNWEACASNVTSAVGLGAGLDPNA